MAQKLDEVAVSHGEQFGADRSLISGFSNALLTSVELSLTFVVFVLGGVWLDRRFNSGHVFTLVLASVAIVGLGARAYYSYVADMNEAQKGTPWGPKE